MPDVNELLDRVITIARIALYNLSTSVTSDGTPYLFHIQETFPYFTARVDTIAVGDDGSEDFDRDTYNVALRCHVGNAGEGNAGGLENSIYDYLPAIKYEINQREWLQSDTDEVTNITGATAYPTAMTSLIRARVTSMTGVRIYENNNIRQFGFEITVGCLFDEYIPQDFT